MFSVRRALASRAFAGCILAGCAFLVQAVELKVPPVALAQVRRIYVDMLAGGAVGEQMRDILIASIQATGMFAVTDNPDRADAILRGSTDEAVFTDEHHATDSLGFHVSDGKGSSSRAIMGAAVSNQSNMSAGITDSQTNISKERRHEARASVRLINADGDIVWSAMMESGGGKFRGALADVGDKLARRLADDSKRQRELSAIAARVPGTPPPQGPPPRQ
jgi:hypothetical protein